MALQEDVRPVQIVGEDTDPQVLSEPTVAGVTDTATGSQMRVRKRDGSLEPVDLNKIVRPSPGVRPASRAST